MASHNDHYVPRSHSREWVPGNLVDLIAHTTDRGFEPAKAFASNNEYTVQVLGTTNRALDDVFDNQWNYFCSVARPLLAKRLPLDLRGKMATRSWMASQWSRSPGLLMARDLLMASVLSPEQIKAFVEADVRLSIAPEIAAGVVLQPEMLRQYSPHRESVRRRDQALIFDALGVEIATWEVSVDRRLPGEPAYVLSDHPAVLSGFENGARTHVRLAFYCADELCVAITPDVRLRATRPGVQLPDFDAESFNIAQAVQAARFVVCRSCDDLPLDFGSIQELRSRPLPRHEARNVDPTHNPWSRQYVASDRKIQNLVDGTRRAEDAQREVSLKAAWARLELPG